MQKDWFLFVLAFYFLNTLCFAQITEVKDSAKKNNIILKTDILNPALIPITKINVFSFTVEKLFKQRHSVQLTYSISFFNHNANGGISPNYTVDGGNDKNHTYHLIPEYKFFVSKKKAYTGYYVGVFGSYINETDNYTDYTYVSAGHSAFKPNTNILVYGPATITNSYQENIQSLGGGFINGLQYYLFKHITLDFLVGLGIRKNIQTSGSISESNQAKLLLRLALNIGYRF